MLGHFFEVLQCVLIHEIFTCYFLYGFGFILMEKYLKLPPSKIFNFGSFILDILDIRLHSNVRPLSYILFGHNWHITLYKV